MLMYPKIDPVALQLGPFAVHWYGLTYLAAFGLFYWLGTRRLAHPPFGSIAGPGAWTRKDVEDILFLGVMVLWPLATPTIGFLKSLSW